MRRAPDQWMEIAEKTRHACIGSVVGPGHGLVNARYGKPLALGLALATSLPACSTLTQGTLAKREDYLAAMAEHGGGSPAAAERAFPERESGGFLTTLERGWLGVVGGAATPAEAALAAEAMVPVGRDLEARKTLSLSREAKAYFYKETEDGYFPAEHEAVVFHIVNGFAFLQAGALGSAKVEARKASFYLQSDFGSQPGFDDPALRLWLATLWAGTGEWESARVDFRALARMGFPWAKSLADRQGQPASLALVLGGPGPDLVWKPGLEAGVAGVQFEQGAASALPMVEGMNLIGGASSAAWYARHVERDHLLRDVLSGSRYMVESVAPAGAAGAVMATGATLGAVVMVGGVAGGAAIVYFGVKALAGAASFGEASAYALAGIVAAGGYLGYLGVTTGQRLMSKSANASQRILESGLSPVDSYRYARFLPDHVYLLVGERPLGDGVLTQGGDPAHYEPFLRRSVDGRAVAAFYLPGTPAERSGAALKAAWTDRTHRRTWAFVTGKADESAARASCEALTRIDSVTWSLPAWSEFLDARDAGLLDPRRNPRFAEKLRESGEFWSRAASGTRSTSQTSQRCRAVDPEDGGEGTVTDCLAPRARLCVARRPDRD